MSVQTASDAGTSLNAERLKYVTERFAALQGLTFVALGVLLGLESIGNISNIPRWLEPIAGIGLLVTFRYIPKYYESRFGWVEPRTPTNKQALIFVLIIVVLLFWGRRVEHYAGPILSNFTHCIHLMISDPTDQVDLLPLVLWIVSLSTSIRKRSMRMDPYQVYFSGLGMIICAVIAFLPLLRPDTRQLMIWRVLNAGSFGLTLIASGLYDHLTLVRLLPKRIAENDDE